VARLRLVVEKVSNVLKRFNNPGLDVGTLERAFEHKAKTLKADAVNLIKASKPPDQLGEDGIKGKLAKAVEALTAGTSTGEFSEEAERNLGDLRKLMIEATKQNLKDMEQGNFTAKGTAYENDNHLCAKVLAWRYHQCVDLEVGDVFKAEAKETLGYGQKCSRCCHCF
jgi:hypothetical protein